MHYVKHFTINGVDTKQVACIELKGKPNAATEGSVGLLAIDISSPMHDVYKCIGVEGNIYHWELLSSGTCIMSSIITGAGEELAEFPYDKLRTVANYIVKVGDVIIDKEGFLYQVESVGYDYCVARYNGTQIVSGIPKVGKVDNGKLLSVVNGCHTFVPVEDSSVAGYVDPMFDKVNEDIAKNTEDISKNTENIMQKLAEIAPYSLLSPDGNEQYGVETGKTYRVFADVNPSNSNKYNGELLLSFTSTKGSIVSKRYEMPIDIDKRGYFDLYVKDLICEGSSTSGQTEHINITYQVDGGELQTAEFRLATYYDGYALINTIRLYVVGATKCLKANEEPYLR